jgi:hypothetical protein
METNRNYLHKIILDGTGDNRWLGITFRKSKTFIDLSHGTPDGTDLTLATGEQRNEFYKLRSLENLYIDFQPGCNLYNQ